MQPLKRFTQCGSLTMLFAVFIVLFGVSSTALTTFGKSNPNTLQQAPTPPPVKARECLNQNDCAAIQDTSCVKDPNDLRLRCLCGDNKAPINGICIARYRGLRHTCIDNNQCDEGMLCAADNSTKTPAFGMGLKGTLKFCMCDEEAGYIENTRDSKCSGAMPLFTGVFIPLLSLTIGSIFARKPIQY